MLNIRGVLEVEGFSDEVVGDPGAHMHAMTYIENLAASDTGYQMCMELLTDGTSCDDRVKFHLLAAIKEYVNERYADETAEGRERMRRFLARYIAVQSESKRYDTAVVRLAAAQIHVIVFEFDYVLHWNDYFDDICASAYAGIKTVDHTLRIVDLTSLWLKSSEEVEDKMPDEYREIQLAREFLQVNDLARVITFLCNVITEYQPLEVIALKVIHDLLTWIDVCYFDELRVVDVVTTRLYTVEAWEVAVDCFVLMTCRIKSPSRKQAMLETVFAVMESRMQDASPSEYRAKIGHLHDVLGAGLVASHDDAMKSWQYSLSAVFRDMVSGLFDKVHVYLTQPDPETSLSVANFTLRYVQLMEKYSCVHSQHVAALYRVCVDKMKLVVDADDVREDRDDGYRAAFSEVFRSLTRVDKDTAYATILAMQEDVMEEGVDAADVDDLELSMYLLQLFCEARNEIAPNQITYEVDTLLSQLISPLITSTIRHHPHPTIVNRYFKTLSVGTPTMAADTPSLQRLYALLVSEHALGHAHPDVRRGCARYLRDMTAALPPSVTILDSRRLVDRVQSHVAVDAVALSDASRLHLHETLAHLVKRGDLTPGERRSLHNDIMNAALVKLRENTFMWPRTSAAHRDELAAGVCCAVDIVTRSTRPYDNERELADAGCADNYLSMFDAFQHIPTPILTRDDVHASIRRLVKRLVFVLADKFLPAVADVIQMVCKTSTVTRIGDDTDMLVYLIDTYAYKLVPTLRKEFSFIGESVYLPTALALSKEHGGTSADDGAGGGGGGAHRDLFERSYLAYMRAIVRNNIFDQLFRQGQKAHIFGVIYILSSGCYPSVLPHETFQTFAAYLQMEPSDMLVYLDMITEEVKGLFLTEFEMVC